MTGHRWMAVSTVLLFGGAPLAGQRAVVLNVNGGGYNHLVNLNQSGSATADFKPGYNLGGSIGAELSRYLGLHADFTFAHAQARGASTFAGSTFNRYFYGAHLELRYPLASGFTPFGFAGGGAVTIDQVNAPGLGLFTRPAGMLGAGIGYLLPRSNAEMFGEAKSLIYEWNRGGFNKTLWDVTYSVGLAYRLQLR